MQNKSTKKRSAIIIIIAAVAAILVAGGASSSACNVAIAVNGDATSKQDSREDSRSKVAPHVEVPNARP